MEEDDSLRQPLKREQLKKISAINADWCSSLCPNLFISCYLIVSLSLICLYQDSGDEWVEAQTKPAKAWKIPEQSKTSEGSSSPAQNVQVGTVLCPTLSQLSSLVPYFIE